MGLLWKHMQQALRTGIDPLGTLLQRAVRDGVDLLRKHMQLPHSGQVPCKSRDAMHQFEIPSLHLADLF